MGLCERMEFFEWKKTGMSERGIKRDRRVALAQDKAVALWIVWPAGVDAQHGEIQRHQDVGS